MHDSCTDDLNEIKHNIGDFVYYCKCQCEHCTVMPTATEYLCCREIGHINNMLHDFDSSHEGFENVCLNVWVLQAAYFSYRQQYGSGQTRQKPVHE